MRGMADGTAKPVIFISYSRKDEPQEPAAGQVAWLTYVQSHLAPAVKTGIFDLFIDQDMQIGVDWRPEIEAKLNACDICLLLASRHSLSSDFILDVEMKRMLERRKTEGTPIFPILLSAVTRATAPWVWELNMRPRGLKPLALYPLAERDGVMAEIVDEIAEIAAKIAEIKKAAIAALPQIRLGEIKASRGKIKISSFTPFGARKIERAALKRLEADLEKALPGSAAVVQLDTIRLPETPYERLVGRENELKRLDEAWGNPGVNILSLVAEAGAGKSALVNEWLKRMQAENYRGADGVLGWSFIQSSKACASSAYQFLDWALEKLNIKISTTNAIAKGAAIAEGLAKRRVLLFLDGVELLQRGPPQTGQLMDLGLGTLLRRFAAAPQVGLHGLIVITSRLGVADIARWKDTAAPVLDVGRLSDEAGAALLRDNGVWGTDKELKAAARDFGGHPLVLGLLASFLKERHFGDLRRRGRIHDIFVDPTTAARPRERGDEIVQKE